MTNWSTHIRRSILSVPIRDRDAVSNSWRHNADAICIDLASAPAARELTRESIAQAGRGGAEVFVRINKGLAYADIEASAWPGLTGIVLPQSESAQDVSEAEALLLGMERKHGIRQGSLQVFLEIGSPAGVWNIRELLYASERVTSVTLNETQLCRALGIVPREDFDPIHWARGRIILEAIAAQREPVGLTPPLSVLPRLVDQEELLRLAIRARNTGFKGAICIDPSWVEPCNKGFAPQEDLIDYHHEVRRVFAEGVARGTAAVPLDGRMVDVPVDERARMTLAWWDRVQKREAEKAAVLAASGSARS
jgi:citrate lyase subunit beta/citryl-CoA lyase